MYVNQVVSTGYYVVVDFSLSPVWLVCFKRKLVILWLLKLLRNFIDHTHPCPLWVHRRRQWVREEDLAKDLKLHSKQLRRTLRFFEEEKLVTRDHRKEVNTFVAPQTRRIVIALYVVI